jgi:hypothetical protein
MSQPVQVGAAVLLLIARVRPSPQPLGDATAKSLTNMSRRGLRASFSKSRESDQSIRVIVSSSAAVSIPNIHSVWMHSNARRPVFALGQRRRRTDAVRRLWRIEAFADHRYERSSPTF